MKLTKKKAVELHRELWTWVAKQDPHQITSHWPRWKCNGGDIDEVLNDCFFCEWASQKAGPEAKIFCYCCPGDWTPHGTCIPTLQNTLRIRDIPIRKHIRR